MRAARAASRVGPRVAVSGRHHVPQLQGRPGALVIAHELAIAAALSLLAGLVLDYAAGRYQDTYRERRLHRAGAWSCTMAIASTVGFGAAVEVSVFMMIPYCLGLWWGTLLAGRKAVVAVPEARATIRRWPPRRQRSRPPARSPSPRAGG